MLNRGANPADRVISLDGAMKASVRNNGHTHRQVTIRVLGKREGVPYEVERTLCVDCHEVISERPLRRAAA
jgi:hypothetical protein